MANEQLVKTGIQFLFADHATDFGAAPATAANSLIIGSPTDVQMDLTGLSASGGATQRQSAKADLTTPWSGLWTVDACIEHETAPADGGVVEFYWGASPSATAGTGNPAGLGGSDASYAPASGLNGQLQFIGVLSLRNNVINIGHVGIFTPWYRYGMLVVVNQGSTATRSTATAMDETHIVMTEVIGELQ